MKAILTYHVAPGKVVAADAVKPISTDTVNGKSFTSSQRDGAVCVDDAKVIRADMVASKGVTHVIDSVISCLNNCFEPLKRCLEILSGNAGHSRFFDQMAVFKWRFSFAGTSGRDQPHGL